MPAPTLSTDVSIVNAALGRIGVSTYITSLSQASAEAVAANNVYAMCRNQVLAAVDWPWARRRQWLTQLGSSSWSSGTTYAQGQAVAYNNGSTNYVYVSLANGNLDQQPDISPTWWQQVSRDDWGFVYLLPSDCIAPRKLITGVRAPPPDMEYPFELENDPTLGPILCTDQSPAELRYTAAVTTVAWFTPGFVDALAWRLAVELTLALRKQPEVGKAAALAYDLAVGRAIAESLNAQREDPPPPPDFIVGR